MIRALLCGALMGVCGISLLVGAVTAAPALMPATPLTTNLDVSDETVPLIFCAGPNEMGTGTGFRVSPSLVITAGHVGGIGACYIDGELTELVTIDRANDFAILKTKPKRHWWRISCEPMEFGETYYALGYAKGGPLYTEEVFGTINLPTPRSVNPGFGETGMFVGREQFIPGMSGGPIVRSNGKLVGIVIGYNTAVKVSYGRFLNDTEVCKKS